MSKHGSSDNGAIKRIAIFRALYLGDLILAVPALRSIRRAFPGAEITFIGLPWARDFLRRFGYTDHFVEFPGCAGLPEVAVNADQTRAFLAQEQARGYDLAIQMHGDGRVSNSLVAALGAIRTIGFSLDGRNDSLLTASLRYVEAEHETSKCLRLAKLAGATSDDPSLEFPLNQADQDEAATLCRAQRLRTSDRLIGLHIGAKHSARRWPATRWARVADTLATAVGAQIVLTGSEAEREMAAEVVTAARVPVVNLAGQTSLGGLAALIDRVMLFVSVDSGPAHLAKALGIRSVTIFGPTDPRRWGPLDRQEHRVVQSQVPCAPCANHVCPTDHRCLTSISPSEVLAEALQLVVAQPTGEEMR